MKLRLTVGLLVAALSTPATAASDSDIVDGAGYIYLYAKRCSTFDKLPLKTQNALTEIMRIQCDAVVAAAIKHEEELIARVGKNVMCGMIERSFPSLF